ncbi:hypothetical protein 7t3_0153 [Salmonella phage 7t3]|nr:hypothetical protein 7t3_0153 [Salmonella phage 7t3]
MTAFFIFSLYFNTTTQRHQQAHNGLLDSTQYVCLP